MNNHIAEEKPLVILPSLAKRLGSVKRAAVLQQIHSLAQSQPINELLDQRGYRWVSGTYKELAAEHFPMWSARVLRSHIVWLEKNGYLVSAQFGSGDFDRTKYYRLEYSRLEQTK